MFLRLSNIKRKAIIIIMFCFFIINLFIPSLKVSAIDKGPELTDYFSIINENGSSQTVNFDDIEDNHQPKTHFRSAFSNDLKDITYGVVYLNGSSYDGNNYLTYNNLSNPGYTGYTTGSYARDAAYLGTSNGKIRAKQSGVIMEFDARDVTIVDYSTANISYYYINDGYIYHKFYYGSSNKFNSYRVGYKQSYMKENVKYYSYDGHYFYTDYTKMIDNYKNNSYNLSLNPSNPYYNYFQFLSHRSKSSINASDYNKMVVDRVGESTSKMKGLGDAYINSQNSFGINSLLMFSVSTNESAWGTSKIAIDKNNLFGHGAGDNNPYGGANGYNSPEDSIKYHAEIFISQKYLDNEDYRYNGGHLGDKSSGINVKYASDPYWGEKAASLYYYHDELNDYNKYSIGIIEGISKEYKLYKNASYTSTVTHVLGKGISPRVYNLPVIILEKVFDESGNEWYKIQSDTPLNASRTDTDWSAIYKMDRDFLYVPAKTVTLINQNNIPQQNMRGDMNGNKKIDAADYLMIMDTILGKFKPNENQKEAGDVNHNGKIDAADYLMIMDCILGKIKL